MTALHAFGLTAAACALTLIALGALVVRRRIATRTSLAHGDTNGPLHCAIRAHANFAENAPIFLITLLAAALMDASAAMVGGLGALFVAARLMHAYGVSAGVKALRWRQIGMIATWTTMILAAGLIVSLAAGVSA